MKTFKNVSYFAIVLALILNPVVLFTLVSSAQAESQPAGGAQPPEGHIPVTSPTADPSGVPSGVPAQPTKSTGTATTTVTATGTKVHQDSLTGREQNKVLSKPAFNAEAHAQKVNEIVQRVNRDHPSSFMYDPSWKKRLPFKIATAVTQENGVKGEFGVQVNIPNSTVKEKPGQLQDTAISYVSAIHYVDDGKSQPSFYGYNTDMLIVYRDPPKESGEKSTATLMFPNGGEVTVPKERIRQEPDQRFHSLSEIIMEYGSEYGLKIDPKYRSERVGSLVDKFNNVVKDAYYNKEKPFYLNSGQEGEEFGGQSHSGVEVNIPKAKEGNEKKILVRDYISQIEYLRPVPGKRDVPLLIIHRKPPRHLGGVPTAHIFTPTGDTLVVSEEELAQNPDLLNKPIETPKPKESAKPAGLWEKLGDFSSARKLLPVGHVLEKSETGKDSTTYRYVSQRDKNRLDAKQGPRNYGFDCVDPVYEIVQQKGGPVTKISIIVPEQKSRARFGARGDLNHLQNYEGSVVPEGFVVSQLNKPGTYGSETSYTYVSPEDFALEKDGKIPPATAGFINAAQYTNPIYQVSVRKDDGIVKKIEITIPITE